MERFKEIYKHTLKWEGGDKLHKISGDAGGWTKYGIAYNMNKSKFKSLDEFKAMNYDRSAEIAYSNYYKPLNMGSVNKSAQAMYFDIAFNMGVGTAIKLAQRSLGIKDDGIIGKITLSKLSSLDKTKLYNERMKRYNSIVRNNPSQSKFLKGWTNRANYFLNTNI